MCHSFVVCRLAKHDGLRNISLTPQCFIHSIEFLYTTLLSCPNLFHYSSATAVPTSSMKLTITIQGHKDFSLL